MDSRVSTSTKTEQFSGTTVVSTAHCSLVKKIQQQQPRTHSGKFRIRLNPDGTCTIRSVRDSDNQAKNLGADNSLDLPEKVSSGPCPVLPSDCLQAKQRPKPYSATMEVKKQEPERSCEGFLELKLEASKRKFHQQYKSIEDRRKRIKMVDFRDIQVPPEETQNCRRRRC